MNFLELVEKRYSCRDYLDKKVEREKIERCLEASRLAPSAVNAQPWNFIVVDDPELKRKVAEETFDALASFNKFSLKAPTLVVVLNENPKLTGIMGRFIQGRDFTLVDIGIAASHFCLKATEEGLGTCIMGWFDEKDIKKILKIPASKSVSLVIAVGYPADKPRKKNRKPLDKIMKYNL